ncbi:MAG: hypothetical protein U0176_17745 [Bacteroidia bacterium]
MAEQIGIGTLLGSDFTVTGYADADGRRLIRVKSRLDKLQWKRSPTMQWSREAARHFGAASTIAGGIWKNVPGGLKRLMDAGAFNRLVSTCRMLQEWDGNLGDLDGFRNLDLSEGSYGPHRVVRRGSGWVVEGLEALMGELDRVTVVGLNQNSQNSPNSQDLDGGLGAGPEALEGGALGQVDTRAVGGGGLSKCESECESERKKRRKKIRRMAGVVSEKDFRHDTGRFWERVEDVYGQEENPKVRYWEGRGMFDYGRVTPPKVVFGQRFLRSPYVTCWPYEGNLGKLDCLNPNSPNSPNFKNGVRVRQNWESDERPDRRVRLWVQACEIGRVREVGGRKWGSV